MFRPTVYMWCAHTPMERKTIPKMASTIDS